MEEAFKIEHLCKKYKQFALDDVNITLPKGCIMGFIGENGTGKSTTIKAMLGLVKKDSGKVWIDGKEFSGQEKDLKEHIGVVMDTAHFSDELTFSDINRIMKHIYRTWDEGKFHRFQSDFKLDGQKRIKEYSRGMKMKLSIAVALSHDSKLLILDEATSGLDPVVRDAMLDTFLDFIQDENHSIFISSHILSDLEKICDYITFIHNGRILFSENKDELLESFRLVKGKKSDIEKLDSSAVIGIRENAFGTEALVKTSGISGHLPADTVTIEDIMLYYVKEA